MTIIIHGPEDEDCDQVEPFRLEAVRCQSSQVNHRFCFVLPFLLEMQLKLEIELKLVSHAFQFTKRTQRQQGGCVAH